MAILISKADGDLTASGVFAAADTGSGATNLIRYGYTSFSAGVTTTSSSFTVANGSIIDAVLLFVTRNGTATSGTFKVDLLKGGVSQASVTVNKSDLPDNSNARPVPVLFVLDNTATGDGGSNWTIAVTLVGSGSLNYYRASSTAANFTRALRTTTGVTASAGDDIVIVGELATSGAYTSRTIHMNSTAATVYGSGVRNTTSVSGGQFIISFGASLIFDNDAATNYVLRLAADLLVYMGTLNIGTSSDPIPYDGTAVLEFQQISTSGDFGLCLYDNSTLTSRGSPRTPGKEIVSCKLTADTPVDNMVSTRGNTSGTTISASSASIIESAGLDPSKTTLALRSVAANTSNTIHGMYCGAPVPPASQSHVFAVYVERGPGTNNRYVRFVVGSSLSLLPINAIYADYDLQTGTVVTAVTARGNGTATSADIIPLGDGFLLILIGIPANTASSYNICLFSGNTYPVVAYADNNSINFYASDFYDFYGTSLPSATLSVDTDTGWLAGDVVAVASTTRVSSDGEVLQLGSDATSSTLPMNKVYNNNHSGTSPTQAEVILLTRNVRIRSTSPTLHTYIWMTGTAIIDVAWTEIYYASSTTSSSDSVTKCLSIEGVTSGTAGQKSLTYNSIHDCNTNTIYIPSIWSSLNLNVSYNVFWRAGIAGSTDSIQMSSNGMTATDWTFDHNIILRPSRYGMNIAAPGGTVTNNTVAGGSSAGIIIQLYPTSALGVYDGNVVHSNTGNGVWCNGGNGTLSNTMVWRTDGNNGGVYVTARSELTFDGLNVFGTDASCVNVSTGSSVHIKDAHLTSETGFTTAATFNVSDSVNMILDSVTTEADGARIPAATLFNFAANSKYNFTAYANNCKLDYGTSLFANQDTWMGDSSFLSSTKHNQVSGDHRTYMLYGLVQSDAVNYRTAAPSMRLTPSDAVNKLESGLYGKGMLTAVPSSGQVDILVYIRKSDSGDGAAYNGNQPRLIQRANPALGQDDDIVVATASGALGDWELLSGTSSVATDDGAFEFIVDCDGTAGFVNIDDWAASPHV